MQKILILCISLKKSISRQTIINQQMQALIHNAPENLHIDFQFFEAVYGKDLPIEYISFLELHRKFSKQCEHALGPSEYGCFLSHMTIWQRLVRGDYRDYQRIIILEDDVIVNINHIYEKIASLMVTNPPFAFLGGHTEPSRRRIRGYVDTSNLFFYQAGPKDLYTGAFAYSLTAEVAQKFIKKHIRRLSYLDDWTYLLSENITTPFYYCFEHNDEVVSNIADDRKIFMKKPNRLKKNYRKIKNDIISRIHSIFLFKKIIRLADFMQHDKNQLITFDFISSKQP